MSEYSDTQTEKNIFTDTEEEYFREERERERERETRETRLERKNES